MVYSLAALEPPRKVVWGTHARPQEAVDQRSVTKRNRASFLGVVHRACQPWCGGRMVECGALGGRCSQQVRDAALSAARFEHPWRPSGVLLQLRGHELIPVLQDEQAAQVEHKPVGIIHDIDETPAGADLAVCQLMSHFRARLRVE